MRPVMITLMSGYFDDLASECLEGVYLLDASSAHAQWEAIFPGSKGLYDASSPNWLDSVRWEWAGDWLTAYNGQTDFAGVLQMISERTGWVADEDLLFIQNRDTMFSLSLAGFASAWSGLMAACDDGPLLLSKAKAGPPCFRFAPIGAIQFCDVRT